MLIIKSLFYQVAIPDNEPYAIYSNDSFVDEDGNILDETYGDIIIQTPSARYIMKNVYSAYDYTARIIEYIKRHKDDGVIYIEMNDLNEYWEDHEGTFEIESV